nr:ABC transporter permease [Brevibacterium sp. 91QC2O2]
MRSSTRGSRPRHPTEARRKGITVAISTPTAPVGVSAAGQGHKRIGRISVNKIFLVLSYAWIVLVVLAALVPGLLTRGNPLDLDPDNVLLAPGAGGLLGTDQYGRSVLTLLIYGARTAIIIGLAATAIGLVIGTVIGLAAGYVGGVVDMVIGRVLDILMSFPGVLMALIITAALGATTGNLILAVGIAAIPQFARVMRGQTIAVRSKLYIEAARASGFSNRRIIFGHVLPNAVAPIVVLATVTVGVSIVAAASLSFLGLGPRSDIPDWGQLLAMGQPYLSAAWWISTFSGVALTITVIAVSLIGDSVSDAMEKG